MKVIAIITLFIMGALRASAQTLPPQMEINEKLTITPADVSAKTVKSPGRKRLASESNHSGYNFQSKRTIQTLGAVYLTKGKAFTFTAGDSIVLAPGFEVDSTTEFTAEIKDLPANTVIAPEATLASTQAPDTKIENAGTLKAFTLNPNPASEQVHIQYEVIKTATVNLALYTLAGTPVQSFINSKQQEPGSYKLVLPVSKIPSGIYVVSLKINNQMISQRVVIR